MKRKLTMGAALICTGFLLLLYTLDYKQAFHSLWPLLILLSGAFFLHMSFKIKGPDLYLFPGLLCTLGGIFIFLINTVITPQNLIRVWPVFMTITGISILPYAFSKKDEHRASLLVPAIFIILLSGLFLLFSLKIVKMSFFQFAVTWWPASIIIAGLIFIIFALIKPHQEQRP